MHPADNVFMEERSYKKSDFMAVPIKDFVTGAIIPVDLFIQLSDTKFVQIAHAGERVQMERIQSYEKKNVSQLLIKKTSYSRYLNEGFSVASVTIKSKEAHQTQKQTALTKMCSNVFSEIEQMGFNSDSFQHAKSITALTVALCTGKVDFYQLVSEFALADQSLYGHAVAVSTVSVMIGMGLNWKSVTIEKLGLGGLLHDIGKQGIPASLKKPRVLMSPAEVAEYESHAIKGMESLRPIPDMPDDVVAIAYEHHELCNGKGFPRKIKQMYINPLARVVGLADKFCHLTMKSADAPFPQSPQEALAHIQKNLSSAYWSDAIGVLKTLVPVKTGKSAA